MRESVLVTGGAGYVGSVLVGKLLSSGRRVTVLDSLVYGPAGLLPHIADPGLRFVRGDVRDHDLVQSLVGSHGEVVHLAAIVGAPACDRSPREAEEVNREASFRIASLLDGRPAVFPCTNSGYGTTSGAVRCDEETPLEPVSLYGRTKVDAEGAMLLAGAVSLRLATAFGPSPRMRLDLLVNDLTHRARRDGYLVLYEAHFRRNYLHVADAADAIVFALDNHDRMRGKAYNAGLPGADLSKAELAAKIGEQVPGLRVVECEVGRDPDRRNYIVSTERLSAAGFTAKTSLEEGIRQLLALYGVWPDAGPRNA